MAMSWLRRFCPLDNRGLKCRKANSSSVGWRQIFDTFWIKILMTLPFLWHFCPSDDRHFKGRRTSNFQWFMQFWLALWKEKWSNMRHNGLSDLRPTLVECRRFDVTPPTAKKSVCVENATDKCRISDMQGVRFWVEILLCSIHMI